MHCLIRTEASYLSTLLMRYALIILPAGVEYLRLNQNFFTFRLAFEEPDWQKRVDIWVSSTSLHYHWPLYPSDSPVTTEPLDLVSKTHTKNLALLHHSLALSHPSTPTPSHLELPNSPMVKDDDLTPKPNTTTAIALLHPCYRKASVCRQDISGSPSILLRSN